jgi:transglutaminase-like putative cysteine protease
LSSFIVSSCMNVGSNVPAWWQKQRVVLWPKLFLHYLYISHTLHVLPIPPSVWSGHEPPPHKIISILQSLSLKQAKYSPQQPVLTNLQSNEESLLGCDAVLLGE